MRKHCAFGSVSCSLGSFFIACVVFCFFFLYMYNCVYTISIYKILFFSIYTISIYILPYVNQRSEFHLGVVNASFFIF